jgi:translation elongation factor P/translation initiation factor 5A
LGRATSDFARYENLYKVVLLQNNSMSKHSSKTKRRAKYVFTQQEKATAFQTSVIKAKKRI